MKKQTGLFLRMLEETEFEKLCAELRTLRTKAALMKRAGFRPRIHDFVRGLRFSSLLTYRIRDLLRTSGLTASWGQLIDEDGNTCSPECDIIIHGECANLRWNGNSGDKDPHVMDYHFVPCGEARAVVSCKSLLRGASDVNKERVYLSRLTRYVKTVWLFAECCRQGKSRAIRTAAKNTGFKRFWFLYDWVDDDPDFDVRRASKTDQWWDFVAAVRQLATHPAKSKSCTAAIKKSKS
jgi:hypothetical protein